MSKKGRSHLRGERGQQFADQIRGRPLERVLCVSLDISKYFHVVMIHNALGEIVTPTFEIDMFQAGFEQLCRAIDDASARTQAEVVWVGMEPTGHYFENLARHLLGRPQPVRLINSYAVKENRHQQLMRCEKSDEIDVAAIGDLLRRGEGTPYQPVTGIYLQLQQLDRARLAKTKIQTMLKNQILGHLDRIFPGLVLSGEEAHRRYTPLFVLDFWRCLTLQRLIRICPDPRQLATMSPTELATAFHAQQYPLGPRTAAKLITYAQKVLFPDPELVATRCHLLKEDLALLADVEQHVQNLAEQLGPLLAQTPYYIWTCLQGLAMVQVASLAAALGDPTHYRSARQVFRRSGLVSGRDDSGTRQRKGRGRAIVKTGDVFLRRALMGALDTLLKHQPVLRAYYNRLKQSKPAGVARVATARRALGILWAIQRDQRSTTLVFKLEGSM
jgi:transposase